MRIAVLDVGSNSAHAKIVDLRPGEPPRTVGSVKRPTHLAEAIGRDGIISDEAIDRLVTAVADAVFTAGTDDVHEFIAFATSAVRDAANRDVVTARVASETGVRLGFLSGCDEARLTFLAARAWHGWSAGSMLLLDIGGGSLEIAYGTGQDPALALSLPLGAGRLTRDFLPGDPPRRSDVRRLRRHVRDRLKEAVAAVREYAEPRHVVATSKTFKQLARLTGAPKSGPYVSRTLRLDRLRDRIPELEKRDRAHRAKLKGVSASRAHQILAGAIVAETIMDSLGLERVEICPWALREGIVCHRMQSMPAFATAGDLTALVQAPQGPRRLRQVCTTD